jgi:hypothetical protein
MKQHYYTHAIWKLFCLILCFSFAHCSNKNKALEEEKDKLRGREIKEYKKKFDFNVDSLIKNVNDLKKTNEITEELKRPIIIYSLSNKKVVFNYYYNLNLPNNFKSFSLDSIRTIVILENIRIDVGTYGNNKTKAQKIQTIIRMFDRKKMVELKSFHIDGNDPPNQIEYRHYCPDTLTGSAPSQDEILKSIKSIINI